MSKLQERVRDTRALFRLFRDGCVSMDVGLDPPPGYGVIGISDMCQAAPLPARQPFYNTGALFVRNATLFTRQAALLIKQ